MPVGAPEMTPLRRLFLGRRPAKGIVWFALPGGETLFDVGRPADALYLVRSGRLAVVREREDGSAHVVGVVCPGEPVGEMALFGGVSHSAKVVALRDSEILALPRDAFLLEARRRPELMAELARLMVLRSRPSGAGGLGEPKVFGFVSVDGAARARPLAERLARRLSREGRGVAVVGSDALRRDAAWFTQLETQTDHVLLCAEADEAEWRQVCGRQVDHLHLLARGDGGAPDGSVRLRVEAAAQPNRPSDLILLSSGARRPGGAQAWADAAGAKGAVHVREGSERDLARLARRVTGQAVGLVLSGGGARAYAHVGVLRALEEAGEPVDTIGGASMGAIVGAGVCAGWDLQELDARLRDAFVSTNPVGDIAFPMVALSRGQRVRARLKAAFGEQEIADLDLPFFAVSSNLTSGLPMVHRRGPVRHALRASSALPGVLPPVVEDGQVLVDGGVLRNLPTEIMREGHRGPILAVDVALAEALAPEEVERPPSLSRWLLSGAWRRGPPVVALLIRSATVTTHREFVAAREASDVLVVPQIPDVGLQDWRSYGPAVEAGYAAARDVLAGLDGPLTRVRRSAEPAPRVLEPGPDPTDEGDERDPEASDAA